MEKTQKYEEPTLVEFGSWDVLTRDGNINGALGFNKCSDTEPSGFAKLNCGS